MLHTHTHTQTHSLVKIALKIPQENNTIKTTQSIYRVSMFGIYVIYLSFIVTHN